MWAISVDELADSQALMKRLNLTYPLGIDSDLRTIRAYGVEMVGKAIAVPSTFVVRPSDGKIMYRHVGETIFDRPALQAIFAAVDKARTP